MQHKSKLTINFSSKVGFANVTLSATLQNLSLQATSVVSTRTSTLGWKEAVITQMLCLVTSGWNFPYLLLVSLGPGWEDCSNIFLFVSGSPRRRAACTQCESFSHPHPESLSLVGMFLVGRPQRMHFFLTMGFENSFLPVKVHSPAVVYELEQKKTTHICILSLSSKRPSHPNPQKCHLFCMEATPSSPHILNGQEAEWDLFQLFPLPPTSSYSNSSHSGISVYTKATPCPSTDAQEVIGIWLGSPAYPALSEKSPTKKRSQKAPFRILGGCCNSSPEVARGRSPA